MRESFIPNEFDATKWDQIEPFVKQLLARNLNCSNCIENLIADASELAEHISEAGALLYIDMTCNTEDIEKKNAFLDFSGNVRPKLSEFSDELNRKIIDHPKLEELPDRYELIIKSIKTDIEIFRKENIPLSVRQTELVTESQSINGSMTVKFDGKERTLPEMNIYLESKNRLERAAAWKKISERRMEDHERLTEIFEELIDIRHRIATNAGFDNYVHYMFKAMHRFDYSIDDCIEFHNSIESVCMPLIKGIDAERKKAFGLDQLAPWDINEKTGSGPDIFDRDPLKPFKNVEEMVNKIGDMFYEMSNDLGEKFQKLVEMDSLDLETRKGKAPGGYQYYLEKSRVPFIFMNSSGFQRDLETMIHEAGHAFHSLYCSDLELIEERNYPIEFAEVASMSMELLTHDGWGHFYNKEDASRARKSHLEGVLFLLPWICTIDSFQHWIYSNPNRSREERTEVWLSIRDRFGIQLDWSEHSDFREISWQQQGHLYGAPFYYIEYGIAQLGSLQLWKTNRINPKKALNDYKDSMKLGNTKTLPELFEAADLDFRFDESHVSSLIDTVEIALLEN